MFNKTIAIQILIISLNFFFITILGYVDWITGHEINFFIFYFIPVGFAGWRFGYTASILSSLVCAVFWYAADTTSGHIYTVQWYALWNTLIRLTSFLVIGCNAAFAKRLINSERIKSKELAALFLKVKLLEGLLPICSVCKKIRDKKEHWQQIEEYICKHSEATFTHGYCPECAERLLRDAGLQ